jgi:tRNA 2-thiouridine synthesizing protein E
MSSITIRQFEVETTADNRLVHLKDWDVEVAFALAEQDNIQLTDEHWEIINIMREFYEKFNISPIKKLLKNYIREQLGDDTKASDAYLGSLFPQNILIQGTRIAGLPMPMLDAEVERCTWGHNKANLKLVKSAEEVNRYYEEAFTYQGKLYKVGRFGNLLEDYQDQWDESLAQFMAEKENLQLTEDHWEVINFMRKFYFKYGLTPMVKLLVKYMRHQHGNQLTEGYLYQLFPQGPSRQGSRIAGLSEPQGCID